jgi:hypothetical protein
VDENHWEGTMGPLYSTILHISNKKIQDTRNIYYILKKGGGSDFGSHDGGQ